MKVFITILRDRSGIEEIENLENLRNLKELDLSANQIRKINSHLLANRQLEVRFLINIFNPELN